MSSTPNRHQWKKVAAVATGVAGVYYAYKRWMQYRQELEDEQAAAGYYIRAKAVVDEEQKTNIKTPAAAAGDGNPAGARGGVLPPVPGGVQDAEPWLERAELLIGKPGMLALSRTHVLVVGLGGVGSFAAEFLARAGVGELTIMDGDDVDPTNRNRQLPALVSTQRRLKAQVMKERLLDINPALRLHEKVQFLECDQCGDLI